MKSDKKIILSWSFRCDVGKDLDKVVEREFSFLNVGRYFLIHFYRFPRE